MYTFVKECWTRQHSEIEVKLKNTKHYQLQTNDTDKWIKNDSDGQLRIHKKQVLTKEINYSTKTLTHSISLLNYELHLREKC